MKKNVLIKTLVIALMLAGSATANAQIDLGSILESLTGKSSSKENTSSTTNLLSGLTNIFSSEKQASKNNLVGTWEYSEPAIVFESDNLLAKAGASIASSKIEDKLQEQLSKFGFESGAFSITFNEDGTFEETFNGKNIPGKWEVKDSKLYLTFGMKALPINTQLSGNKLMFVTDATKLLDLVKTIGSKSTNSSFQTVTSLMKSINGMQAGLTLVKK